MWTCDCRLCWHFSNCSLPLGVSDKACFCWMVKSLLTRTNEYKWKFHEAWTLYLYLSFRQRNIIGCNVVLMVKMCSSIFAVFMLYLICILYVLVRGMSLCWCLLLCDSISLWLCDSVILTLLLCGSVALLLWLSVSVCDSLSHSVTLTLLLCDSVTLSTHSCEMINQEPYTVETVLTMGMQTCSFAICLSYSNCIICISVPSLPLCV